MARTFWRVKDFLNLGEHTLPVTLLLFHALQLKRGYGAYCNFLLRIYKILLFSLAGGQIKTNYHLVSRTMWFGAFLLQPTCIWTFLDLNTLESKSLLYLIISHLTSWTKRHKVQFLFIYTFHSFLESSVK